MEGFDYSENFGAFKETNSSRNGYVYGTGFQDMLGRLDEEDWSEESRQSTEKKRRLSFEQVKALERNFDVDNKLEAERKFKLAQELGLRPRQVAIWFQNRRARWKTKRLEKDYDLLKANYDALKLDFKNLEQENATLTIELSNLKAKLVEENAPERHDVNKGFLESPYTKFKQSNIQDQSSNEKLTRTIESSLIEDRPSLGDSDGVPVEVSNGSAQLLSSGIVPFHINSLSPSSFSMANWFQSPCTSHQVAKMEDRSLSSVDEHIFSVNQFPSLHWYLPYQ